MKLTFREWYAVERALRLAAEEYREAARTTATTERIAAQFEHQAIDADALADRIENEAQPESIAHCFGGTR